MVNLLPADEADAFRTVLKDCFQRYKMAHAELVDHLCTRAPLATEQMELAEYAIGVIPCDCNILKLGKIDKSRRKKMTIIVQNSLSKSRHISRERASLLFRLMLNTPKALAWRQQHPEMRDPLLLFCLTSKASFIHRPINRQPPEVFPPIGLTPHGVSALARRLTRTLADHNLLKGAHPDVHDCIIKTMREMHTQCNAAFIKRLKHASTMVRIDVTSENVPVKYDSVRRLGHTEEHRTNIDIIHDWRTERPQGARDPDTFQFLKAMLWNDWVRDEELHVLSTRSESSKGLEAATG